MPTIFDLRTTRLLHVGNLRAPSTWAMPTHTHPCWQFVYFLQGCGRICLPNITFHPQQCHVAIYPPGMPHAETADPCEPEETIFFNVDVAGLAPADGPLLLPDPTGEMRWLCEHLYHEFTEHGNTPLATCYAQAFLCLLERAWMTGATSSPDLIDLATQYLEAHYARPITLAQMAEALRVSKGHLVNRFTARMGTSPMRFLQQLRVERAKRLLHTTELSVQAIAIRVGYADPLYFSRVFTRLTGEAPRAYRQHASPVISSMSSGR